MRASKSSHRVLEDVQVELRQHRNLQSQHRGARGHDRQKPLPDPCQNVGFVAHVFAPSDCVNDHACAMEAHQLPAR
jgi:hypothetical protein